MFEQYIRSGREALQYLRNYRQIATSVKKMVREELRDARVYAFGSVVRGDYTALSDIDILVLTDELDNDRAAELKGRIRSKIGISVPLQIHTATNREFHEWYTRFVDKFEEV